MESKRIYVTRLAPYTKKKDLLRLFNEDGVESVVVRRQKTGNVAFLTFPTAEKVVSIIEKSREQNYVLHKRVLRLLLADSWHDRSSVTIDKTEPREETEHSSLNLPEEVIGMISSYLPYSDRARLEQVSTKWRSGSRRSHRYNELSTSSWMFRNSWDEPVVTPNKLYWTIQRCSGTLKKMVVNENSNHITPQMLTIIGKNCSSLTELQVDGMCIRPNGLQAIADSNTGLRKISFGPSVGPVDAHLSSIFQKNVGIEELSFSMTGVIGRCLDNSNLQVQKLKIQGCQSLKSIHLCHFITIQRRLTTLEIHRGKFLDGISIMKTITENVHLKDTLLELQLIGLGIQGPQVEEEEEEEIVNEGAVFFELGDAGRLPGNLSLPSNLTNLRSLNVRFNALIDDGFILELGKHCHFLEHLDITCCTNIRGEFSLDPLMNLEMLKTLRLSMMRPTVATYFMGDLIRLQEIDCRDCLGVGEQEVCHLLRAAPALKLINLEGCKNVGRGVVDCAYNLLRTTNRDAPLKLLLGGTKADRRKKDKKNWLLDIQYVRGSPQM